MEIKIGTFNLNNLFSRFNFAGAIDEIQPDGTGALTVQYEFTDPSTIRIRTFLGKLVKAKDTGDTNKIAERILKMDVHVLAVQEVENIEILKSFNQENLGGHFPFQVLIEGNDHRFINVGILSKLPIGAITSFQTAIHPANPGSRVFSRDLVEVEIFDPTRTKKLFTLYNTHLKSHFGDEDNGGQGKVENDTRRQQQAETIAEIVGKRMKTNSKYMITGDMNDAPDAVPLQQMLKIDGKPLINGLTNPQETRPAKPESDGNNPKNPSWTHRFKKSGQPPEHKLFDQIWLSPSLAQSLQEAWIDRRENHGGDGSDHDPAWVILDV